MCLVAQISFNASWPISFGKVLRKRLEEDEGERERLRERDVHSYDYMSWNEAISHVFSHHTVPLEVMFNSHIIDCE